MSLKDEPRPMPEWLAQLEPTQLAETNFPCKASCSNLYIILPLVATGGQWSSWLGLYIALYMSITG